MERRHGWLFSLMVAAAGSVTVLSSIGVAAILGYLPGLRISGPPAAHEAVSSQFDPAVPSQTGLVARAGEILQQPVPKK